MPLVESQFSESLTLPVLKDGEVQADDEVVLMNTSLAQAPSDRMRTVRLMQRRVRMHARHPWRLLRIKVL